MALARAKHCIQTRTSQEVQMRALSTRQSPTDARTSGG